MDHLKSLNFIINPPPRLINGQLDVVLNYPANRFLYVFVSDRSRKAGLIKMVIEWLPKRT